MFRNVFKYQKLMFNYFIYIPLSIFLSLPKNFIFMSSYWGKWETTL